ncbi:putative RNA-directed DNA polymerase [Helianthus annuus]|nr:putative RNA-directed DNA polymerase [Helianthus annuus]
MNLILWKFQPKIGAYYYKSLEARMECKFFLLEADRLKSMDLQQKSRVRWAANGDENTAFFHGVINANTSNNWITGLRINGDWITSPPLIKDFAFNFFSDKFKEPMVVRPSLVCPNLNRISDEEAGCLIQPFSLLEIKNAIWECDGDKASGPGGINFHFIKRCWDGIQNDFFKLFDEFFVNASITPGCTSSFLALIPKVNDRGGLGDYRPISLIGCVNKVISKVLVNRMKGVIQKLISEEQTAFLANRSILDGPLMLNEILAWLKHTKKKGMLFKWILRKLTTR